MYGCTDLVILLLFFFFLSMNILWMVRSGFEKSSYLALALNVTGYTYPWLLKERVLFLCAYVRAHTCAYMYISLWQCGVISAIHVVICGALVLFFLSFCQVLVEWSTERLACLPLANGAGTASNCKIYWNISYHSGPALCVYVIVLPSEFFFLASWLGSLLRGDVIVYPSNGAWCYCSQAFAQSLRLCCVVVCCLFVCLFPWQSTDMHCVFVSTLQLPFPVCRKRGQGYATSLSPYPTVPRLNWVPLARIYQKRRRQHGLAET